jgi:hypothetical protein
MQAKSVSPKEDYISKNRNTYISNRYILISNGDDNMKSKKQIAIHSPTLNTVMMVEDALKDGELITIADLKRKLHNRVMHNTLMQIIDYLQASGKVMIGTKGILWVFTERKELSKLIKRGSEV